MGKRYKLVSGKVTEVSAQEIDEQFLNNHKKIAISDIEIITNNLRKKYTGYSSEKSIAYDIQADAANNILNAIKNEVNIPLDAKELIEPLANIRGIPIEEMANIISNKSKEARKKILECEMIEDEAENAVNAAKSIAEVEKFMNDFRGKYL